MKISLLHRFYVRLWLAVVLAVCVLTILVGWLVRFQTERMRAEHWADLPAREALLRDASGQIIANTSAQPVRTTGRSMELRVELPAAAKGGQQLAISLPARPRPGEPGAEPRGAIAPFGLALLLAAFAGAVALGSYPVVRRLTQRLESLQRGVERLGAGDLRARVDEGGHDEVAYLARRFNRAADQIEDLVQTQKRLLANASHELRSPLARIRMGLELMQDKPSIALKDEISRSISELDTLIDEILLASRLDAIAADGQSRTLESVDLLALAAEEAARASVELNWQGDWARAQIQGDSRLLRRMIRNLLENAKRYGGQSAELLMSAQADGLRVEVLDRGPGVPPDECEKIFEPFYRSRQASEHDGGVGLGLVLVRSIAQQHGASARCYQRDGGGARFVLHFALGGA